MAYVHQLLDQPSQWQTSQQAGPGSVPKFTSTSIAVKQLLIKNKIINQSKSSLLIWHYVSYLFLFSYRYLNTLSLILSLCYPVGHPQITSEHGFLKCGQSWVQTYNRPARRILFVRGTGNSALSLAHTLTGDACQNPPEIGHWNRIQLQIAIIPV